MRVDAPVRDSAFYSMYEDEIWKPIEGYEGYYEISNCGRVRSLDRVVKSKKGWSKSIKGVILKQTLQHHGYMQISLLKDSHHKAVWVHSLVAKAFLPNPDNLPCVNHKDEDKTNNNVENLEWCTVKYNNNYGDKKQRISLKQRNDPAKSKPVKQMDKDGNVLAIFPSIMEAGRHLGLAKKQEGGIRSVVNKRPHCHTAYGYKWEYV